MFMFMVYVLFTINKASLQKLMRTVSKTHLKFNGYMKKELTSPLRFNDY